MPAQRGNRGREAQGWAQIIFKIQRFYWLGIKRDRFPAGRVLLSPQAAEAGDPPASAYSHVWLIDPEFAHADGTPRIMSLCARVLIEGATRPAEALTNPLGTPDRCPDCLILRAAERREERDRDDEDDEDDDDE